MIFKLSTSLDFMSLDSFESIIIFTSLYTFFTVVSMCLTHHHHRQGHPKATQKPFSINLMSHLENVIFLASLFATDNLLAIIPIL